MKIHTANLIGEVVGQSQLKDELDARIIMAANEIDWNLGNSFKRPTLIADITITDANLPQGTDTKCISLELDGSFAITFPAYWIWKDGLYNGSVMNRIIVDCINGNSGTQEVYYQIIPTQI